MRRQSGADVQTHSVLSLCTRRMPDLPFALSFRAFTRMRSDAERKGTHILACICFSGGETDTRAHAEQEGGRVAAYRAVDFPESRTDTRTHSTGVKNHEGESGFSRGTGDKCLSVRRRLP